MTPSEEKHTKKYIDKMKAILVQKEAEVKNWVERYEKEFKLSDQTRKAREEEVRRNAQVTESYHTLLDEMTRLKGVYADEVKKLHDRLQDTERNLMKVLENRELTIGKLARELKEARESNGAAALKDLRKRIHAKTERVKELEGTVASQAKKILALKSK